MKTLRFLSAPVTSLFDFKIYKEAVSLPSKKSFLYLFYLSALYMLALFALGWFLMPKADAFVGWLKQNIAGVTLNQSGMKLDVSGRSELVHPEYGPLVVFDDTRETIKPEEMGAYRLYVTSKIVYVNRNGVIQANSIGSKDNKNFVTRIDAETIQKVYDQLRGPIAVGLLIATLLVGFVVRMFLAFLLSVFGLILQTFMPRGLSLTQLFNLASFSLSAALLFSIFQLVPVFSVFSVGLLGALLSPSYFVIAVMSQPKIQIDS